MCHWFGFLFFRSHLSHTGPQMLVLPCVYAIIHLCLQVYVVSGNLNPVSLTLETMFRECSYNQTPSFLKVCWKEHLYANMVPLSGLVVYWQLIIELSQKKTFAEKWVHLLNLDFIPDHTKKAHFSKAIFKGLGIEMWVGGRVPV